MELYSFDIFDTCVARLCGGPLNLYEVLSYKVSDLIVAKSTDNNITPEHLRKLFVVARKESGGRLEQIYQQIKEIFPLPCPPSDMANLELMTEQEMIVPIIATRKLVDKLRAKGQIAFISDMYLPTEFLRERLFDLGFFKEGDHIYVSDDLGAWKRDGSLYKYVHSKEGIAYNHWHHYGDNLHSDIKIPRRLGIHSHHISYNYLPYEKQWLTTPQLLNHSLSIMAGLSRAIRLCVDSDQDQSNFVADISAPLQCLWMTHVLQDAKRRKIEKLFFCARDVHSPYKVALRLKTSLPEFHGIDINYFFTSQTASINNEDLALRYYKQIGMVPTEHVAIVDSRTRGWSLARIQESVTHRERPLVMSYYWHLDAREQECRNLLSSFPVDSFIHILDIAANKTERIATLEQITGLFENGLSLNFHRKTIGYTVRPDGRIGPLFNSSDDEISSQMPNVRRLKHTNDALLETYAKGFAACGLHRHTDALIHTLLMPMLIDFASQPHKTYLRYLTKIWILDVKHPYVNSIFNPKNRKGRWLYGSIIYTLPTPLGRLYCKLRYTELSRKLRKIGCKLTPKNR